MLELYPNTSSILLKFELIENSLKNQLVDPNLKKFELELSIFNISFSFIINALKNKYSEIGADFVLCHRDGTLILSNLVTESSQFWFNRHFDICVLIKSPVNSSSNKKNSHQSEIGNFNFNRIFFSIKKFKRYFIK